MKNNHSKNITNTIIKTALDNLPFYGSVMKEIFFDYRSRLKQERLNSFIELLENYFSNHKGIELENFQTEEFSDLFESVIKKVLETKSREKHVYLKNILTNQLTNSSQSINESEIYLHLISFLNDIDIKILNEHKIFNKYFERHLNEIEILEALVIKMKHKAQIDSELNSKGQMVSEKLFIEELKRKNELLEFRKKELISLDEVRFGIFYGISEEQFLYNKQKLSAQGLMIDLGVGINNTKPFQIMSITLFGENFLKYILSNSDK